MHTCKVSAWLEKGRWCVFDSSGALVTRTTQGLSEPHDVLLGVSGEPSSLDWTPQVEGFQLAKVWIVQPAVGGQSPRSWMTIPSTVKGPGTRDP